MAKKPASRKSQSATVYAVGDQVEIVRFGQGEIVELRGPLGPGGAQVYRVVYRRRPRAGYIEVLGSQLRPTPLEKPAEPRACEESHASGATG